ncbi:GAF and ANTAR domain-containing protein (plasmid) [Arthrobacter agilis]|uniref:GAF and ANTAR domain-containing protein n=1 Tax=Arthrobacter agilis TaxID=37921 RepID=UPI00236535F1|nr:GAF and ANTAR domain-containing protein [Arthrobacter agilis]WDF35090.1 GAF and ANTAR domain-containing protein [Arthrobacter agilis]
MDEDLMPDEHELAREAERDTFTAQLQNMVLESEDVQEFLTGLVTVAAQAFTGPFGDVFCGITLLRPRSMITVASSSERAQQVDEVQYGFDDGPCLRAARDGVMIHIKDFLSDSRFPEYREAIAGYGLRSALGIPIRLDEGASAGLDFYSTEPGTFDDKAIRVAEGFARDASQSLRLAVRVAKLTDAATNMRAAMESRTSIDMAIGAIMAQNRCTQDEAIAILRRASSNRNAKLRDICVEILNSLGQHTPVTTHFDT